MLEMLETGAFDYTSTSPTVDLYSQCQLAQCEMTLMYR